MNFLIIILILFIVGIISILIYSNYKDKKWLTIHVERKAIKIDNTKTPYYINNGYHPYDTMCDIDVLHSVYEVQKDEYGNFRVKHTGEIDRELEINAYKVMNKNINYHQKRKV